MNEHPGFSVDADFMLTCDLSSVVLDNNPTNLIIM